MSPSLFHCLQSTHIVAIIIDFQTLFSNQILSVGVGLNSVCYSIPLYTITSSVAVDLNSEPQKIKYCNMKGLWVFTYKQIARQSSKMFRKKIVYWISFYLAQYFKICWGHKSIFFLLRIFIFLPISPPRTSVPLPLPPLRPRYYAMSKNVSIWCYGYFCTVLKKARKPVNTRLSYFYCHLSHGKRAVCSDRPRTCCCRGPASTITEPQINPFIRLRLRVVLYLQ